MNAVFSIKKVLIAFVAIVILFTTITLVINSSVFDEALSPEVVKSLKPVKMPPDEENAYFAIMGLSASNEANMVTTGRRLIDQYLKNRDENNLDELTSEDYTKILGNKDLDDNWQDQINRCSSRTELGCTLKLYQQLSEQPIDEPRLSLMLKRYQHIIEMTQYQPMGHLTFGSPLPNYGTLMKLRRIKLAYAFGSNDPHDFIQYIEKDLKFWKLLLELEGTILDKMVAVASIWSSLHAVVEFTQFHKELSTLDIERLNAILTPLTEEQLDISTAFMYEQKALYGTLKMTDPEQLTAAFGLSSKPISFLIQPNATINDYNQFFIQPLVKLSKSSSKSFANRVNQTQNDQKNCCFNEIQELVDFSPSSLYNLGGKLLLSTSIFQAQDYIARVHDVNGVILLAQLQLEIIKNPEQNIKWLIKNSQITSPYNNQPMSYDEEKGLVRFTCLDKASTCNIKIH